MLDDLEIEIARKRNRTAKPIILAEEDKVIEPRIKCPNCGNCTAPADACPYCETEFDWGF